MTFIPFYILIRKVQSLFFYEHTKDEVKLAQLCVSDFLIHGVAVVRVVLHHEPRIVESLSNGLRIGIESRSHWNDDSLSWRYPKRPAREGQSLFANGNSFVWFCSVSDIR